MLKRLKTFLKNWKFLAINFESEFAFVPKETQIAHEGVKIDSYISFK